MRRHSHSCREHADEVELAEARNLGQFSQADVIFQMRGHVVENAPQPPFINDMLTAQGNWCLSAARVAICDPCHERFCKGLDKDLTGGGRRPHLLDKSPARPPDHLIMQPSKISNRLRIDVLPGGCVGGARKSIERQIDVQYVVPRRDLNILLQHSGWTQPNMAALDFGPLPQAIALPAHHALGMAVGRDADLQVPRRELRDLSGPVMTQICPQASPGKRLGGAQHPLRTVFACAVVMQAHAALAPGRAPGKTLVASG